MHTGIEFEPIISRKDRQGWAGKDRLIRNLKYWVAVLATADIIYTIFAALVIWNEVLK